MAAAHRNSDGYGVAVHDGGKVEIIQGLTKDPEAAAQKVNEVLQQAKDKLAFVHFRYRTVGDICLENLHPIPILTKARDGIDLTFMHNGTVSGFRDDKKSDSVIFAEQILGPLARRSAKFLGEDEVTSDPLLADVLKKYAESVSKFVLLDGNGNSLVINRKQGEEQEYGWSSNTYSLLESNIPKPPKKTSVPVTGSVIYPLSSPWPRTGDSHAKLIETLNNQAPSSTEACAPSIRLTVEEITGHKPKAFTRLDPEQVRELIEEEPDLSAILILDLLYELYNEEFKAAA